MRRLVLLVVAANVIRFLLRRRRRARRDGVSLHYADGSMVTLEPSAPGAERLLALARQAL